MLYIPGTHDEIELAIWKDGFQAQLDEIDENRLVDILRALVAAHHMQLTIEQLIEMISQSIGGKGNS